MPGSNFLKIQPIHIDTFNSESKISLCYEKKHQEVFAAPVTAPSPYCSEYIVITAGDSAECINSPVNLDCFWTVVARH